jgi:hypothetical protein
VLTGGIGARRPDDERILLLLGPEPEGRGRGLDVVRAVNGLPEARVIQTRDTPLEKVRSSSAWFVYEQASMCRLVGTQKELEEVLGASNKVAVKALTGKPILGMEIAASRGQVRSA